MAAASVAAGCSGNKGDAYEFLKPEEARTLAALCDEIIPADDCPSASQAGVVTYIDLQLMRHYRRHQRTYRNGLAQAETFSRERFGLNVTATSPEQMATVRMLERQNRRFFELLRSHTMEGYYGSPRHGGNRDAVSWRMLALAEPPVRGRAKDSFTSKS